MSNRTFAGWMMVGVILSLSIGFVLGAGARGQERATEGLPQISEPRLDEHGNPVPPTAEELADILNKTNVEWKKTIDALAACNAQYSESTVLLTTGGGSFALSISPVSGHFGIQTEGDTRSIWVIPQRVRRVMTLNSTGNEVFYYTDLHTGKLDGPYVPLPATPKIWAESQ